MENRCQYDSRAFYVHLWHLDRNSINILLGVDISSLTSIKHCQSGVYMIQLWRIEKKNLSEGSEAGPKNTWRINHDTA